MISCGKTNRNNPIPEQYETITRMCKLVDIEPISDKDSGHILYHDVLVCLYY